MEFYKEVKPVVDLSMRKLCVKPYYGHKKGCPNYGKKEGCPPHSPTIDKLILLTIKQPIYVIFNRFNFKEHCDRMRGLHPEWTPKQVACCLYWQGKARKVLKGKTKQFIFKHPHYDIIECPEGAGVNLTATMEQIGIELEWPPDNYAYQIYLAGIKK